MTGAAIMQERASCYCQRRASDPRQRGPEGLCNEKGQGMSPRPGRSPMWTLPAPSIMIGVVPERMMVNMELTSSMMEEE